jgi:GR25 family glycosyltransferase involved in LPS biosynthesis
MKNFVITIRENNKSIAAATRCITSGKRYGIDIDFYEAFTPKDYKPYLLENKVNTSPFDNSPYSRVDNAKAAFCSHFSLWQYSAEQNEEVTIFEHDAVIVDSIPDIDYNGCISFGKPSYGKFNTPPNLGSNRLVSKRYFPGAHAYRIKPKTAKVLIDQARLEAHPTDIFLNIETFPFLEEYYPWPVEVRESFSTIQKTEGCLAKHMYNNEYVIEEV